MEEPFCGSLETKTSAPVQLHRFHRTMNVPASIEELNLTLEPLRERLMHHPIYERISDLPSLRLFMESHVFAVWDFMSLLKSLQSRLCCNSVPWTPPAHRLGCRLVNEIVLAEESDVNAEGNYASHFDLYFDAMRYCGANVDPISQFLTLISSGRSVSEALSDIEVSPSVRAFVKHSFQLIESNQLVSLASAFTFGREDLLPDVFRQMVYQLNESNSQLDPLVYYLKRHIELDEDEHGPLANRLIESLCGDSPQDWRLAQDAAVQALEARIMLWDGIAEQIDPQQCLPSNAVS